MTSKDENATKARIGMDAAKEFLQNWGFSNIERVDKKGVGYDFKASKDGLPFTIEVKTTQTKGVPDAFETEFTHLDKHPEFGPDYLLVVRVRKVGEPGWEPTGSHLVSKNEIDLYKEEKEGKKEHKIVAHVKFSSTFQKELWDKKIGEWLDWTEG